MRRQLPFFENIVIPFMNVKRKKQENLYEIYARQSS